MPSSRSSLPVIAQASPPRAEPILLEFGSPVAAVLALPAPRLARGLVWIVFTLFAVFAALAASVPVDRVVTAPGRVVAQDATMVVQPIEMAIVRRIAVREGEHVQAGDLLASLDPTVARADTEQATKQLTALRAETERLRAEADGATFSYAGTDPAYALQAAIAAQRAAERDFRLEQYQQKFDSLGAAFRRAEADAKGFQQRLVVATQLEGLRRQAERLQVGTRVNTLSATDAGLEVKRLLADAEAQQTAAQRDLSALVAERDAFRSNWHSETLQRLSEQTAKLTDAQDALSKAELRAKLIDLRAPADGRVLTVAHVSVGSVLSPGQEFFTVVPDASPLEIEANLSGRDAGFVTRGDAVAIKFDTFPFSQYGQAEGQVRVLSPDSFTAADSRSGAVPAPPGSTELFYRARITLAAMHLHDTPDGFAVQAGMPVTVDIKIGKRTLLSYLLGRVLPVIHGAFHEP